MQPVPICDKLSYTDMAIPSIRAARRQAEARPQNRPQTIRQFFQQSFTIFRYSGRAMQLVWTTSPWLTVGLAVLTVAVGLLPGVIAYLGKLIVDGVVQASQSGLEADRWRTLQYVGWEAVAIVLQSGAQQVISLCQSLLQMLLAQKVNLLVIEKALTLDMAQFEDSEFYDKMSRARDGASHRPLSVVTRSYGFVRDLLSLLTFGGLLLKFSPWAVIVLLLAALPAFVAQTRFAEDAFRLFSWRAPERREHHYLEILLAREDYAMEVKLYQLGPMLLARYKQIFERMYSRRPQLKFAPHRLELRAGADQHGGVLWHLHLDDQRSDCREDFAGRLNAVSAGVSAGTVYLCGAAGLNWRHV